MNRSALRGYTLPGSVVVVLALVYLIAWLTGPGAPGPAAGDAAARTVPVTAVTRDCPPPGPGTGQAHIAMLAAAPRAGAPRAAAAQATASRAATTLAALPSAGDSAGNSAAKPGSSGSTAGPASPEALSLLSPPQAGRSPGTEIAATGQMAPGFAAEQAGADGTGLVACAHPGSDMWFVGTGTQDGGSATWLYLMNSATVPASVEVTVLTDAGVQSAQDNEITVPAGRYLGVNVSSQASGSMVLAVHVQASSGQVAADVWQGGGSGGAWLPAASSPATQVVVPGVTAAAGAAKLLVAVPGGQDARLRVTALTAQGKTQPLGSAPQDAPGDASSSFSLSSLGASAAALVISSNVPVTAGVQVPGSGLGAFTAAAAPVTAQGVAAGNPSGGGDSVGLVLSAPGAGARVAITGVPSSNPERVVPPPQQTVTVQGGRTKQVAVSPPKGASGPFAIVVTPLPGSGPLYAARAVISGGTSGTLRALLPVTNAPSQVQLPPAAASYSAVLPSAG